MLDKLMQHGIGVGGGSNIKSIQSGSFIITGTTLSGEIPISPINFEKSVVRCLRIVSSVSMKYSGNSCVGLYLDNNSNIKFRRASAYNAADSITVYWEVIEFNNVKSLQRGARTINNGDGNVAISPVEINKSIVVSSYTGGSDSTQLSNIVTGAEYLFNGTGNLFYVYGLYSIGSLYWQVIEFN